MVEPTTFVGCIPVARAVAPPGKEFFIIGHEMTDGIDPIGRLLQGGQTVDFYRGVADYLEELAVGPNIAFQGSDVEIADHDAGGVIVGFVLPPGGHLAEEIQLVGEFVVFLGIGNVAAGGDIEVMDFVAVGQGGEDMPAILAVAPMLHTGLLKGVAGEDRDAVIGLHAGDVAVVKTHGLHGVMGEEVVGNLGFLEANDVGFELVCEALEQGQPGADGIDVPGDKAHGREVSYPNRWCWRDRKARQHGRAVGRW